MSESSSPRPKRIAILGGGLGSLITALELTGHEKNRGRYQVTVYHNGWRLGGKGASGRNAQEDERIEEHGLHVWLGFYENAFRLIRAAMAEWQIPPNHPWNAGRPEDRWQNAFKPHSFAPLTERNNGGWDIWPVNFPERNNGTPGDGSPGPFDDFWGLIRVLTHQLMDLGGTDHRELGGSGAPLEQLHPRHTAKAREHHLKLRVHLEKWLDGDQGKPGCLELLLSPLRLFSLGQVLRLVTVMRELVFNDLLTAPEQSVRRLGMLLHVGWALVSGLLWNSFSISRNTLDVLDKEDLRDFLLRYGANEESVNCPMVTAIYAAIFAYEGGDTTKQRLAAGAGIRCLLRIFLGYKKALAWKMQAGMGDTIFTPIYQVLKARGVEFKYFHRVKKLELAEDGERVARVVIGRQVTLQQPGASYQPFRSVKEMDCWPNEPLWDQLNHEEAAEIQQRGVNLEHYYEDTLWPDREVMTLEAGHDVDHIVLGISIGAFPQIASDLISKSTKFSEMVSKVQTTRTQAYQAWLRKDLAGLGWKMASPVLSCYLDPLNTWADMSHLLPREDVDPAMVKNISYFCGPMSDQVPVADVDAHVRANAAATLQELAKSLLPDINAGGQFDKSLLQMEYFRTNTNGSDRYVLTLPGSTEARLRPDESGYENLTLAGDWTRNGLNVGCVEATVMSGRLASRHISGYPTLEEIPGAKGP